MSVFKYMIYWCFLKTIMSYKWNIDEEIDVHDILNADYMPGSLLLLEGNGNSEIIKESTKWKNETIDPNLGSWNTAYSTMGYHRKMINEYLCRNFVADQIISEMTPPHLERRMSGRISSPEITPFSPIPASTKTALDMAAIKDSMLADTGSRGYKDWLTKTTTLEDIYRHYERATNNRELDRQSISRGDGDDDSDDGEEYDGGEVTGYAMPGPVPYPGPFNVAGKLGVDHDETPDYTKTGIVSGHPDLSLSKHGGILHHPGFFPQHAVGHPEPIPNLENHHGHGSFATIETPVLNLGHEEHADIFSTHTVGGGHAGGYDYNPHHVHYHAIPEPVHSGAPEKTGFSIGHDLALHELFDIALTTLAFLSFGMFVLQVIMCITAGKSYPMTMMPMMMDTDADAAGANGNAEIRFRRDANKADRKSSSEMNELARRVLQSIDAVLLAKNDDAVCLKKSLCENNLYSRKRTDQQKIWIPVWGLGLSWLSGRLSVSASPGAAILESLRAAALGLGGADCQKMFPGCDLKAVRQYQHIMNRTEL